MLIPLLILGTAAFATVIGVLLWRLRTRTVYVSPERIVPRYDD